MAYGERGRWTDMLEIANKRARKYPLDFQSRLAQGLAYHRLGNEHMAQIAFDSALAMMDEKEEARMTQFSRILRPRPSDQSKGSIGDTIAFKKLPLAQQRNFEAMYWLMSDPLALTAENEYRLEFLSRVVWSEFRWTNEDLNLHGADTDRGDVFVRYGPPDLEMTVQGNSDPNANVGEAGTTLVWNYRNGLTFLFDMKPGYGTAAVAWSDKDYLDQIKRALPVAFDNVPAARMIDTIPIRVARFRAGNDSTDAVVAARIPIDSLVRGLDLTSAPIDIDFRMFDQYVRVKGVESVQQRVRPDSTTEPLSRIWNRRMGPGINVIRIEAMQVDSRRAARAMSRVDPVITAGFGMSDILLGTKPTLKSGAAPRRWTDIAIEPNIGMFARGSSIGLLWEMYDLTAKDGAAKYRVSIEVERVDRTIVGNFAARVVDGLGRAIGREQRSRDKLTISFDRSAASADALVEFMSLDLSESAAGAYRLRVEITDQATNRKTSRQTVFTIK